MLPHSMLRPILIADDEDEDIVLLIHTLRRSHIENPIHSVSHAQGVLEYLLAHSHSIEDHPERPALIFLDARMPGHDGFFVLEWIHQHKEFHAIPVVVITGDREILETNHAYRLGAIAVLEKEWTADLITKLPVVATRLLRFSSPAAKAA